MTENLEGSKKSLVRNSALRFVLLIGILSFFADFTYEGSRSILGPYLSSLQASAFVVGAFQAWGSCWAMACAWFQAGWPTAPKNSGRSPSWDMWSR